MTALFRGHDDLTARAAELAQEAARFSLSELRYHYPSEVRTDGRTALETLVDETWLGAAERYPHGVPPETRARIEHELAADRGARLRAVLPHGGTIMVRFARSRASSARAAARRPTRRCAICLGMTAVDPARIDLLFERFVSAERGEPPDIDVDFEHERREEVMQYIYRKYGRDRAGADRHGHLLPRPRRLREVGKAWGFSPTDRRRHLRAPSGVEPRGWRSAVREHRPRPRRPPPRSPLALTHELIGFPRHLSQHVGGFVMTRGPPLEWCPSRTRPWRTAR